MKVWTLEHVGYSVDDTYIVGIFSTYNTALNRAKQLVIEKDELSEDELDIETCSYSTNIYDNEGFYHIEYYYLDEIEGE